MEKLTLTSFFLVFLGNICYGHGYEQGCHMRAMQECASVSDLAVVTLDGKFPDEKFLKDQCSNVIRKLECLLKQEETCPVSDMLFVEPGEFKGLAGFKNLIDDICDENSAIRKDYLENLDCVNDHLADLMEANNEAAATFRAFEQHYGLEKDETKEDYKALLCVEFAFLMYETKRAVEETCGNDAMNTMITMINYVGEADPAECAEEIEQLDHYAGLFQEFTSQ